MHVSCAARLRVLLLVVAAFALVIPPHALAVGYVNPVGANHIPFSICPAVDGMNILVPDPVEPLAAMSQEMFDELTGGDTAFPGWSFQSGLPLTGTFHIDQYQSRFRGTHVSGARINARYLRGLGDPPSDRLRWVQLIDTNSPIDPNGGNPPGPPTSPYLDPYPDDADGEGGPFYYSDALNSEFDYRDHVRGGPNHGFGQDYDAHFFDFAHRPHPPTSFVEWHAQLHLTQLSAPQNVIVYEGFRWGFEAACVHWLSLVAFTFGTNGFVTNATYDPASEMLQFSPTRINVLNDSGSLNGVDPEFLSDPLLNAQLIITPFHRVSAPNLPPGLVLFEGGSIQVFGPSMSPMFAARIPYLVLGDDMNAGYNMTGVYSAVQVPPSIPSQFLLGYENFRHAGQGAPPQADRSSSSPDRTNPDGTTSDVGTYPFQSAGYSPQLYVQSMRPIPDLLATGGLTSVNIWNSFSARDPRGGLDLRVDAAELEWGDLGTSVLYDVVRGDLGLLRSTGGDFEAATAECLADNATSPMVPYDLAPPSGAGEWFLVRAKRGSLNGTYDTLQPGQVGSRDPGIIASGFCAQ